MTEKRENWSGQWGFILATIGSAVGLGNIWRFPYLAGTNGGGAFVLVYFGLLFLFGMPLMLAEFAIGRHGQSNVCDCWRAIGKRFVWIGGMGIVTCSLILTFYGMIGGWIVYYLVDGFVTSGQATAEASLEHFNTFSSGITTPVGCQLFFMLLTGGITYFGVSKGLERMNVIMMPALFVLLLLLLPRAIWLPDASKGIAFMLTPDFSKITPKVIVDAVGQVFFSLSIGLSCLIAYAGYLKKDVPLLRCSSMVILADTLVAVATGVIVMTVVFSCGANPGQGPELLFVTLPSLFTTIPGGYYFGIAFFALVFLAALSSSISLLEPLVAYIMDKFRISRQKSVVLCTIAVSAVGVLHVLSMGDTLSGFKVCGKTFFELTEFIACNVLIVFGGFCTCIVVGYFWGIKKAADEIAQGGKHFFPGASLWGIMIKYFAPIGIIIIFINELLAG